MVFLIKHIYNVLLYRRKAVDAQPPHALVAQYTLAPDTPSTMTRPPQTLSDASLRLLVRCRAELPRKPQCGLENAVDRVGVVVVALEARQRHDGASTRGGGGTPRCATAGARRLVRVRVRVRVGVRVRVRLGLRLG